MSTTRTITIRRPVRRVIVSRPGPQGPPGVGMVTPLPYVRVACADGTIHRVWIAAVTGGHTLRWDEEVDGLAAGVPDPVRLLAADGSIWLLVMAQVGTEEEPEYTLRWEQE